MSNKIGVTDEFDVRSTDNTSRFLRRVGFCRNGSDYKKQSVDIYNPMLEKCNGNYIKDNVFTCTYSSAKIDYEMLRTLHFRIPIILYFSYS